MELVTKTQNIFWQEQGRGEITLLFVHGWCIDGDYWSEQLNNLNRNFRVIALDLPGFGRSAARRETWTIRSYAVDVIRFIEEQKLMNVILVGHSMAGEICLEATLTNHPSIIGLIGVDTFKNVGVIPDARQIEEYAGFMTMLMDDFRYTAPMLAENLLFHKQTPANIRERVKRDFALANPNVAYPALSDLFQYDMNVTERLSMLKKKLTLINSTMPPTATTNLEKYCGNGYQLFEISDTGHYPMLEKPLIFNALLIQAILPMISTSTS
ncbi:MAG: alpha/beta hydrolase [Calditrichota bacterium]